MSVQSNCAFYTNAAQIILLYSFIPNKRGETSGSKGDFEFDPMTAAKPR